MSVGVASIRNIPWVDDTATEYNTMPSFVGALIDYWNVPSRQELKIVPKFYSLASEWKKSIGPTSSVADMAIHPSYQKIIGMGNDAVPFILRELEKEPHHWFWALKAITGEDPVAPENRGQIYKMTEAWLEWGKKEGYNW